MGPIHLVGDVGEVAEVGESIGFGEDAANDADHDPIHLLAVDVQGDDAAHAYVRPVKSSVGIEDDGIGVIRVEPTAFDDDAEHGGVRLRRIDDGFRFRYRGECAARRAEAPGFHGVDAGHIIELLGDAVGAIGAAKDHLHVVVEKRESVVHQFVGAKRGC